MNEQNGTQSPQPMKRGYKALLAEANAVVEALTPEDAKALLNDPDVVFVDLRDIRELSREGFIPGSFHAPRGMLEFWVDPEALITNRSSHLESASFSIVTADGARRSPHRRCSRWAWAACVISKGG